MRSALDLLRALAAILPSTTTAHLHAVGPVLVVGLCDRRGDPSLPKFQEATLDDADLSRDPTDVAREIAAYAEEHWPKTTETP